MRKYVGRGAHTTKSSVRTTAALTLAGSVLVSLVAAPSAQAISKQPTNVVVSKLNTACEVLTRESDAVEIDDDTDLRGIVKYLKIGIVQIKKYDRSVVAIRPAVAAQKSALALVHKYALANVSELTKLTAVASKGDDVKFLAQAEAMVARLESSRMKTIGALELAELPACDALLNSGAETSGTTTMPDVPLVNPALLPAAVPSYQFAEPTADELEQRKLIGMLTGGVYTGVTFTRLHDAANTYTATVAAFEFAPTVADDARRRAVNVGAAAADMVVADPVNGFDLRVSGPARGVDGTVFKILAHRGSLLIEFSSAPNVADGAALRAAATAYLQAVPAAPVAPPADTTTPSTTV